MRIKEYSHRHGKELCKLTDPKAYEEVLSLLANLENFPHGSVKGKTVKNHISSVFTANDWIAENPIEFSVGKRDYVDLMKRRVTIEMEWSRFEMFFRDFFRFMLMYERKQIDVGIILTYSDEAYQRWHGEAKPYRAARASLSKLIDFLSGDYATVITVPIWCIGIE